MGGRATAAAAPPRPTREARPPARGRPRLPDGHRLRPAERHPLGDAAPGDGLRLWHDLLAAAAVLATPRRLEEAVARPPAARRAGAGHRLGQGLCGQPEYPRLGRESLVRPTPHHLRSTTPAPSGSICTASVQVFQVSFYWKRAPQG